MCYAIIIDHNTVPYVLENVRFDITSFQEVASLPTTSKLSEWEYPYNNCVALCYIQCTVVYMYANKFLFNESKSTPSPLHLNF